MLCEDRSMQRRETFNLTSIQWDGIVKANSNYLQTQSHPHYQEDGRVYSCL